MSASTEPLKCLTCASYRSPPNNEGEGFCVNETVLSLRGSQWNPEHRMSRCNVVLAHNVCTGKHREYIVTGERP